MTAHIFMTGASGYIGGQLLHDLTVKHPQYKVTALVRSDEQGGEIGKIYPSIRFVTGNLDSRDVIIEESKKANVVLQMANCNHVGVLVAMIEGIKQGGKKAKLVQLSGAGSIIDISNGYGNATTRIWDDIADLPEISTFPSTRLQSTTDQLILKTQKNHDIKTVIVSSPTVYGKADGPKPFSFGIPTLVEAIQKRGKAFTVGEGKSVANHIHVKDIAAALLYVVEQALMQDGGLVEWGEEGFYFPEGEEVVFGDVVTDLAEKMKEKGLIENVERDKLGLEEVLKIHPWGVMMWGSNVRIRGSRYERLGLKSTQHGVVASNYELLA